VEIVGGDRGGRQGAQHARVQRLDQDGPHDVCDLGLVRVGHECARRGLEGEGYPRRAIARGRRDVSEASIYAASDWAAVSSFAGDGPPIRSRGFTRPREAFSIATAASREGSDLPRLMREACERLHPRSCANHTSSRAAPIHRSSLVMLGMCT